MALDMNDIMTLKGLEGNGNSSYENYKIAHNEGKRANGVGITGLVIGSAGLLAGITAWIFGGMQAKSQSAAAREAARGAADIANANHNAMLALYSQGMANTNANLDRLANTLAAERTERIAGDVTLTNTVNDSVSGSQQGTLTAQQAAELSAIQTATNQVTAGLMTGQFSQNPQQVVLMSGRRECNCPASDCGCGN